MKRPTSARTKLASKDLGEYISSWRKLRGLTMQQLAEKANTTRATISKLEHGDSKVSLETFLNVCGSLDVLDRVKEAVDPYETDFGRIRADQELPQRVRSRS